MIRQRYLSLPKLGVESREESHMANRDLNLGAVSAENSNLSLQRLQAEETACPGYGGGWPGEHEGQIAWEKMGCTPEESQRTTRPSRRRCGLLD
jgi:hypothetical protein